MALAAFLVLRTGDPLTYTSDSIDQISYIRTVARTGEVFPSEFYYRGAGILTSDIRKGMAHSLWGTICLLSGIQDPLPVWPFISIIGDWGIILALFCAGTLLFSSAPTGVVAAVLFVFFYHGGLRGLQLITIAYGYPFGKMFYIAALSHIPVWLHGLRRKDLIMAVIAAVVATMTHVAHFIVLLFASTIFALSLPLAGKDRRRWKETAFTYLLLATCTIAASVPYLLLRYFRHYAPANPIHTHAQGILYLAGPFMVTNPVVVYQSAGMLGILSIIGVLVLWKKAMTDALVRMLVFGTAAVYLLLFNPVLVPLLLDRISYLLLRFEFAVPSMLFCALLIRELFATGSVRGRSRGVAFINLVRILVIAMLAVPLIRTAGGSAYSGKGLAEYQAKSSRRQADLFRRLDGTVPAGSVIASDPLTSYCIPAFTDGFAICPNDQHSVPNDSTAVKRIYDTRKLFMPGVPATEKARVMKRYGARYLLVNGGLPENIQTMYWKLSPAGAAKAALSLKNLSGTFKEVWVYHGSSLFEFTGIVPDAEEPLEKNRRLSCAGDIIVESGVGGVTITGFEVEPDTVSIGDTARVSICWTAGEHIEPGSYTAHLRFDTAYERGFLYSEFWPKIYRKVLERLHGVKYRFRKDFHPLSGLRPPDTWEEGEQVADILDIYIPRDISPGCYSIELSMTLKTQYPNYRLGDILKDRDYYSGNRVGTLFVRPSGTVPSTGEGR